MNDWHRLIVPLIILTFWGLKHIFEQEPQRQAARPLPPGPRPDLPGSRAPDNPTLRWPGPADGAKRSNDEVIIIRSDSILPEPTRSAQSRRPASRAKPPNRRVEPERPRPLSVGVSQTIGPLIGQTLGLGPVSLSQQATPATPTQPVTERVVGITQALRSPQRLREAFLVNELLQPPLSLRRPRRG